ncbi:MAG: cytosolic protein [Desulfobacterales bacterium]|nr:cytosolic protein [Desulfobacterales bacterium]
MAKKDYDSPWKTIIEKYFRELIEFYFPDILDAIDWTKGYEFLDKELKKITKESKVGKRYVDKLVKVYLTTGNERWILIHGEVQGKREKDFEERMYVYNYRAYDRFKRKVASIAILTDKSKKWKPNKFAYEVLGTKVSMEFLIVKLMDYNDKWQELENSKNPFAIVTMAHLKTLETAESEDIRYHWKKYLIKKLYKRGYSKQDIINLLDFIDWIMTLPKGLEKKLLKKISLWKEEEKMRYITSFERIGHERGLKEGVKKGLEKGVKKGVKKGIEKGVEKGAGKVLKHLLISRFKIEDAQANDVLKSLKLTSRKIEKISEKILEAKTLEEFTNSVK